MQLLRHDDKVYIYCDGRVIDADVPMGGVAFERKQLPGIDIGLFTMPRDRFVALVPERVRNEALVELVPMQYPSGQLLLNAAVFESGEIRAEVARFDGYAVVDGFSKDNAVPMTGDSLDHKILWQRDGKTYSLEALPEQYQGKAVRLRLWIKQARVYALAT